MDKITVIKLGGKIISDSEKLDLTLRSFAKIAGKKILIHGGGNEATKLAEKLGLKVKIVEGRRITDRNMLEVATMVYAGLVNKRVVAKLQSLLVNAIGLSGADGNIILSEKRSAKPIDYGYVGDIKKVNVESLSSLINADLIPVVCALTHDGNGNMLNTNADSIAGEIAKALSEDFEVTLTYAFELKGVLEDFNNKDSVITKINTNNFEDMKAKGAINEGMIPKVYNAISASKKGVKNVFICHYGNIDAPIKGTEICAV